MVFVELVLFSITDLLADIFVVAERDIENIKEASFESILLRAGELVGITFAVVGKIVRLTDTAVLGMVVDILDEFIKNIVALVFIKV